MMWAFKLVMVAWGLQATLTSHLFEGHILLGRPNSVEDIPRSSVFWTSVCPPLCLSLAGSVLRELQRWVIICTHQEAFLFKNTLTFHPDMSPYCMSLRSCRKVSGGNAMVLPWINALSVKGKALRTFTLQLGLFYTHRLPLLSPDDDPLCP